MTVEVHQQQEAAGLARASTRLSPRVLQTRGVELGRIRLGEKGSRGEPRKLSAFRFTSAHRRHIEDLAARYGGEARAWDNGGRPQWEVLTEARSVPVIVAAASLSQYLEVWSGGGCERRCTGEVELLSDSPCLCAAEGLAVDERPCKPTTRVSVMLPELEAVGLWRVESHGWNAAAELPSTADLAALVGTLVSAKLLLDERVSVRGGMTRRFVVPVLDLEVAPRRLAGIVTGIAAGPAGVEAAPAPRAIEAGPSPAFAATGLAPSRDDLELIAAATTIDRLRELWRELAARNGLNPAIEAAWRARGQALAEQASDEAGEDPSHVTDELWPAVTQPGTAAPAAAERTEDQAWEDLVRAAGARGLTTDAVEALVEDLHGKPAGACTAAELDTAVASLPPLGGAT